MFSLNKNGQLCGTRRPRYVLLPVWPVVLVAESLRLEDIFSSENCAFLSFSSWPPGHCRIVCYWLVHENSFSESLFTMTMEIVDILRSENAHSHIEHLYIDVIIAMIGVLTALCSPTVTSLRGA